jgi:hypothetical protein
MGSQLNRSRLLSSRLVWHLNQSVGYLPPPLVGGEQVETKHQGCVAAAEVARKDSGSIAHTKWSMGAPRWVRRASCVMV